MADRGVPEESTSPPEPRCPDTAPKDRGDGGHCWCWWSESLPRPCCWCGYAEDDDEACAANGEEHRRG